MTIEESIEHSTFHLAYEVCLIHVIEPTIVTRFTERENKQEGVIALQWFGEAKDLPPHTQLYFNLSQDIYYPKLSRVSFLGPVKDWPNPNMINELAHNLTGDNLDGLIMHILNTSDIELSDEKSFQPSTIFYPFKTTLNDSHYGVIRPKPYYNSKAFEEEVSRVYTILYRNIFN